MSANTESFHDETVTATVASVTRYFQHGLALMATEFGTTKCNADSVALAGFVQACAVIHASELLSHDLGEVIDSRLFQLALAIE